MYASEVVRRFPVGLSKDDVETNLSSSLSSQMFDVHHVLEFREYLHQLLFSLHTLARRGLDESHIRDEELESFAVDQ